MMSQILLNINFLARVACVDGELEGEFEGLYFLDFISSGRAQRISKSKTPRGLKYERLQITACRKRDLHIRLQPKTGKSFARTCDINSLPFLFQTNIYI